MHPCSRFIHSKMGVMHKGNRFIKLEIIMRKHAKHYHAHVKSFSRAQKSFLCACKSYLLLSFILGTKIKIEKINEKI